MTVAYFCILLAFLMPYVSTLYFKRQGGFRRRDNHDTRGFVTCLEGKAKRAHAATENAFEVTPFFAAAVIVGQTSGNAAQGTLDVLAILFLLSRGVYFYCYVQDQARVRSMVWALGLLCIIGLFVAAF